MLFNTTKLFGLVAAFQPFSGNRSINDKATNVSLIFPGMPNDMHVANLASRASAGNGIELRIYPLGDSITNGFQSSDDNGYRIGLQQKLAGSKLNFVGSKTGGTMSDGINQIAAKAKEFQHNLDPNVILLHAGTNDLNSSPPVDPDHAPDRLGALIDQLIANGPDAVILVAQIIHSADANAEARFKKYNEAIPGLVEKRVKASHKVMVVDMRSVTVGDLKDGLHPNDAGYQKMANLWFKAIQQAADKGWIKAPKTPPPDHGRQGQGSGQHCQQPPFWAPAFPNDNKPIASGVGHNGDMKFKDKWIPKLKVATGIGKVGAGVVFADLDGDGRADYLFVNKTTGSIIAYLNTGKGDEITWKPVNNGKEIASGVAPRELVRFADIDLDGKDDYVVMGKNSGSVTVWLNRGAGAKAPGGWNWDGPHQVAPGAPGAKGANVLFADINGRPDYLVKNPKGAIGAYLNIGKPKTIQGIQWVGAGQIAAGFGTDDISIADINGDGSYSILVFHRLYYILGYADTEIQQGRADYLLWGNKGALTGYLNYRTEKEGQPGWASTGNMGSIAAGLGKSSAYCRLADLNGDGKADYVLVYDDGSIDVYLNHGEADTSVIGDGVRLASLSGKGTGLDDYVWLAPNAAVTLYVNGGYSSDGKDWIWYPINGGKEIANGAGAKRDQIIFADMDGDGKDDFCIVDPKSGAITLYKNGGPQPNGDWGWIPTGQIATGIGGPGSAVRLADMDGDGKADYLLLDPTGAAKLYLNKGQKPGGWNWVPYNNEKPIATGIGSLREHIQLKDIDGDGKADYIGVGQLDGSATVYINKGPQPGGDGRWGWVPFNNGKPVASGVGSVGADVRWGRIEKTNRYSYLALSPNTGALKAWKNGCNSLRSGSGSGANSGANSGNGSGSGSDNGMTIGYIDGGLPIPGSGLGGLHLPTKGIPAITGLMPYVVTAQNDVTTASNAVRGLTEGKPTSAGVSAAANAVATAAKDLSALAEQAKSWDLSSFSPSLRPKVQEAQKALQAASKSVSDLVPQLRDCAQSPDKCHKTYGEIADKLKSPDASPPLTLFGIEAHTPSGSSFNGSGGSGGSGNSHSGSGGSGHGNFGGGLPIPKGGLGGLGLPTRGAGAINALKPYAITTRNALGAASDLMSGLWSGAGGPSSGQVSAAVDALSAASSDFSALSSQFEAIELSSFSGGELAAIQTERTGLQTASKIVADILSRLKGCVATPGPCRNSVAGFVGSLGAVNVIGVLSWIQNHGTPTAASQTPKSPASPASPTKTSDPLSWVLNTVPGTSVKAFKDFIRTLPDGGSGEQWIFDNSDFQNYVTKLTLEEAGVVNRDPIVDMIVANVPLTTFNNLVTNSTTQGRLERRWQEPTVIQSHPSEPAQMILSMPKYEDIYSLVYSDSFNDYTFEATAGDGSFVYVLDAGFKFDHPEFQGTAPESIVGSGNSIDDIDGHGTAVASLINGVSLGIAKKAQVIGVKVKSKADRTETVDVWHTWRRVVQEAEGKNRLRKTVIVFTTTMLQPFALINHVNFDEWYKPPYNIPRPSENDMWVPMLGEAWRRGIVVVIAAGNTNQGAPTQGFGVPLRFGSPNNPLITVGAIDKSGARTAFNLPPGPGPDHLLTGDISIWALGKDVRIANNRPGINGLYRNDDGTSFAAPQVAALAAYYLRLPNTVLPAANELVPMAVKRHLLATARDASHDGQGVAHNGVWDALCGPIHSPKRGRRAEKLVFDDNDDMILGKAALLGLESEDI
ncbi:MAG: hypothetical protein Q9181_002669 [Wetmoreana brouardii]